MLVNNYISKFLALSIIFGLLLFPTITFADLDSDGDGMPDSWENKMGLDPYTADALEDADNDGFHNYLEYWRNTDPRDDLSKPAYEYFGIVPTFSVAKSNVVNLANNNIIYIESAPVSLQANETKSLATSAYSHFWAGQPFSIGSDADATDNPVPSHLVGTKFIIPNYRDDHFYYIANANTQGPAANVTIKYAAIIDNKTVAPGQVLTVEVVGNDDVSTIITSDQPVLVAHRGEAANSSSSRDVYPVPPAAKDLWGVRSTAVVLGALEDNTTVDVYTSENDTVQYILNAGQRTVVSIGSNTSQGEGSGLHIVADKPIAAAQGADADGTEQTAFLDTAFLGNSYGIPVDTQYVAVVCPETTDITLHFPADSTLDETQTCQANGLNPGKAYFGLNINGVNITAGAIISSAKPFYAIYETSATNDEHNLFGDFMHLYAWIAFKDVALQAAINESLGKPADARISRKELIGVTQINAAGKGIHDISALKFATNLKHLDLSGNSLQTELSPLANMANLEYLDLSQTGITDISVLSNKLNLTTLKLARDQISDFTPIANLAKLQDLDLSFTGISDLSLLQGLTDLVSLNLQGNQGITDLSPLAGLVNLVSLNVSSTAITSLQGIQSLLNLTELSASSNRLLTDINALAYLTNLDTVNLLGDPIPQDQDPDGDGATNKEEIAVATNPLNAAKHPLFKSEGDVLGLKAIVDQLKTLIVSGRYDTVDGWTVSTEDFDADGDMDVFVYIQGQSEQYIDYNCWYDCGEDYYGQPQGFLLLFENVNGTYQRSLLDPALLRPYGDISQMLPYDFDNDGRKDILLVFYGQTLLLHNETVAGGPLNFVDVTQSSGIPTNGSSTASLIDINRDGYLDLAYGKKLLQYDATNKAYVDVTASTGISNYPNIVITADINGDALLDMISTDAVLINNGDGTLTQYPIDLALVSTDPSIKYGLHNIVPFDYNNDGKQDLALFETVYTLPGPYSSYDYSGETRTRVFENNSYFDAGLNQYVVRFDQVSEYIASPTTFTQGGSSGDYNNDGIADLLMTQYGYNKTDLLQGDGNGGFTPPQRIGLHGVSNKAVIFADYNGDGAIDVFMPEGSYGGHSDYLFTGYPNGNHYLNIDLQGSVQHSGYSGTPDAIGARVEVTAGGVTQTKYVQSGLGTTHRLFFGLGTAADASVKVTWPSGIVTELTQTEIGAVDRVLNIEEPQLVIIVDPQLKAAVYQALGLDPSVTLEQKHIDLLTSLDASNLGITDITGIETAVNLKTLVLSNNNIQDITPLAQMPNLSRVYLDGNPLNGSADSDGDGATDAQEIAAATNPMNTDNHPVYRVEPDQLGFAALVSELSAEEPTLGNLLDGWHGAWEDLDRDGDLDAVIYIHGGDETANYSGPTHGKLAVFENVNGVYQRRAFAPGEDRFDGDLRGMQVVDFDNDGERDLLLAFERQLALLRNTTIAGGDLQFTDVTTAQGLPAVIDLNGIAVLDANRDGFVDIFTVAGLQSQLWKFNRANAVFEDVTAVSGLASAADFGLTIVADLDNNGTLDLVTHETTGAGRGLVAFNNNGDGTFTQLINDQGLSVLATEDFRTIIPTDYDNDGRMDLVIFHNTAAGDQTPQIQLVKNAAPQSLQLDSTAGGLSDVLGPTDEVMSGAVGDFNNDGLVDFVKGERNAGRTALFSNQGAGQFSKLDNIAGIGNMGNRLPVFSDYNNDGQLDLLLPGSVNATGDTANYYYTNLGTPNHYLGIVLVGRVQRTGITSGRDALGATVQVTANGVTQTQQEISRFGGNYRLHFGLGSADSAEVTVKWPSGLTTHLTTADVYGQGGVDQVLTISEPSTDGSARVAGDLLAYYVFDEGSGSVVHDQSGAAQPLDLTAGGSYTWLSGRNGMVLSNATLQNLAAIRLNERLSTSGPFTFEIWFKPADVVQGGPAQIASYFGEANSQRLAIGQEGAILEGDARTAAGTTLATRVTTPLTADVQHVAMTYDGSQVAWYKNGLLASVNEETITLPDGTVASDLLLGNSYAGDKPWAGEIYQVAIYGRALSGAEINQNYRDGADPLNPDEDGDGVPDPMDAFPLDPTETLDSDNDGIGDNADLDDDNDGVLDVNDSAPLDASQFMAGSYADAAHVLNRITFGVTPKLLNEVAKIGINTYIQQQLNPMTIQEDPSFQPMDETTIDNFAKLRYDALYRMFYSRKQLQEVMTQFWDNHFSTQYYKHKQTVFELRERQQFRQFALGNFRDLLEISAKSPAMLAFLDNYNSKAPEANENYARELMELHTLGVGNYTAADIVALAKIFTGWSIDVYDNQTPDNSVEGKFVFKPEYHTPGPKVFLGHTIYDQLNPIREGEMALDILANHPATRSFICRKLVQLLVADDFNNQDSTTPAGRIHSQCVSTFYSSNGDMQAVLTSILTSPDFMDAINERIKVKSPLEFSASAVRNFSADASLNNAADLNNAMAYMGMSLFQQGPPTGFPETGDKWTNSNMLLQRIRTANQIAFQTTDTKLDVMNLVNSNGLHTAQEIVSFLFNIAYGGEYTDLEYNQALEILNPVGQPAFHLTLPDAELRLRRLLGTMMSYPGFQYQ